VVAQATGVDGRGHEVGAERVHLELVGHAGDITEVVPVLALGHRRAGGRFDGDETRRRTLPQVLAEEGEDDARRVRAAAGTGEDDVGLFLTGLAELVEQFEADDALVNHDVVEHAPQRIVGARVVGGDLDGLGDRHPERTGGVGELLTHPATGLGQFGGRGVALGAIDPHLDVPVGLLLVRGAHLPGL
jgi:hypothetical protein